MEHYFLKKSKERLPAGPLRRIEASGQGFTLLEMLIVIAIIGILISIGVASYTQAQIKARNARRQADIKSVQTAIEQYYADNNGQYTNTPGTCDFTATTKYLPAGAFPTDPKSPSYAYSFACTDATSYCFCAQLEPAGNTLGNSTDSNCTRGVGEFYCVSQLQ